MMFQSSQEFKEPSMICWYLHQYYEPRDVITRLFLICVNHNQIGGTWLFISRTDMTSWFRLICSHLVGTEMSASLCHHLISASEVA